MAYPGQSKREHFRIELVDYSGRKKSYVCSHNKLSTAELLVFPNHIFANENIQSSFSLVDILYYK